MEGEVIPEEKWDTITIRLPVSKKKELIDLVKGAGQANISEVARRGIYREMEEMRKDAA